MATRGFLGIDVGTQGLSVVLTDESMKVLATGEAGYEMCPDLEEGCYEQRPADWIDALIAAVKQLHSRLDSTPEVASIGISGQMHGEVLIDKDNQPLQPARLWCDARNDEQGQQLTDLLGTKMPKRITAARWLWTLQHRPEVAAQTSRITTPGGWIAYYLTGTYHLGIGDASGMFPIDQQTLGYDAQRMKQFDALASELGATCSLKELLPEVRVAGDDAGQLTETAAQALGLQAGIPVAPAEGDQPASLAGSLIGGAGMVSVSFGTSVCANSVGDRGFAGVSDAVDHFCAPDGKPINMVWLRNGTTYMNTVVEMFGQALPGETADAFGSIMPQVVQADPDCGGMLALPFMDDEPGLGVTSGGKALLFGINSSNAKPGNAVKAALLATMFNLRKGSEVLDQQGYPRTELVLSGGLTRTPELGQVLADVFDTPVRLLADADEGCAWGAALLAKYRTLDHRPAWDEFLQQHDDGNATRFVPQPDAVKVYQQSYQRYLELMGQVVG